MEGRIITLKHHTLNMLDNSAKGIKTKHDKQNEIHLQKQEGHSSNSLLKQISKTYSEFSDTCVKL